MAYSGYIYKIIWPLVAFWSNGGPVCEPAPSAFPSFVVLCSVPPPHRYGDPRAADAARQHAESLVQPNAPPQNAAANAARNCCLSEMSNYGQICHVKLPVDFFSMSVLSISESYVHCRLHTLRKVIDDKCLTAFAFLPQHYHVLLIESNPTTTDRRIIETLLKSKSKTASWL